MLGAAVWLVLSSILYSLRLSNGSGSFPKPLSAKEERHFLALAAEGDLNARNILIERNLRLRIVVVVGADQFFVAFFDEVYIIDDEFAPKSILVHIVAIGEFLHIYCDIFLDFLPQMLCNRRKRFEPCFIADILVAIGEESVIRLAHRIEFFDVFLV